MGADSVEHRFTGAYGEDGGRRVKDFTPPVIIPSRASSRLPKRAFR